MKRQFLFTIGLVLALAATLCGTQPVSAQSAIQIDATALSASQLILNGVATFPTDTVQSFDLLPGNYQLQYGTVAGFGMANFTVTASHTVDYDPSLDLILSGRGTNSLTVLGATVQIDATALSVANLTLQGVGSFPTQDTFSATLLPGIHRLAYATVVSSAAANFTVNASGAVDYDPSLDLILSGRGTNSLTILGATVQIDATALSVANLTLQGVNSFATQATFSATLLPGVHNLAYATVIGSAAAHFTVNASGAVDYDLSLESILSGRGTNSLTVLGATVQIDATALSVTSLLLGGISDFPTQTIFSATLLPGPHLLQYGTVVGKALVNFTVTAPGAVDYDPSLDLILSGRNTSTLTLVGVPIRINAATLNGSSFDILGVGTFAACPVPIVTLLPATHRFVTTDAQFNFMVTNGAVVDYDAALDSFVSGRGTNTLTIHGSGVDCNLAPVAEAGGPYDVNEGGSVTVTASGNDPEAGTLTYAWDLDDNGTFETPGQTVTFSAVGLEAPDTKTIQVQVTDEGGLTATDQAEVTIIHNFSDFLPPVDPLPTFNAVKAGGSVPVRFSLSGDQGLSIFAAGYPKSEAIQCDSHAQVDGIEETVSAGNSSLSYDPATDMYTYVWKTNKIWANTCRQLVLKLDDGTFYRANFKFTK